MEFAAIGVGGVCARGFEIVNPTSLDYGFEWVREEEGGADGRRARQELFACLQPQGVLRGGKKCLINFEFHPAKIGIVEEFWRFRIAQFDLTIPFLLVGNAAEPKVIFDRSL